ncbi:MAG: polysaccharide biosynthesis tyrosine autokinase [Luteitalea sp.]|nr:polysaccharide biosynthesis tyrosine autokinase [Luteitalea sp.]
MDPIPPLSDRYGSERSAPSQPAVDGKTLPPPPDATGAPDVRRAGGYPDSAYGVSVDGATAGVGGRLLEYLRILHKRRRMAITAFVVIFGGITLYTFTATPLYEANAQVLIESELANVVQFEEVLDQERQTDDYYQTQYRILQSRAVARHTIDALELWDHGLLAPRADDQGFSVASVTATVTGWVQRLVTGTGSNASEPADEGESLAQSEVIDTFLGHLRITPIRNSRLVDVVFVSPDPRLSARVANAHAQQYMEQNLEYKLSAAKEAADWLNQRAGEQGKLVETSEQALQAYREKTDSISLEDRQNIVVQRLGELNAALTRARTERIQKETAYKQLEAIQDDPEALDTFPAILGNAFIQQLKGQLADLQRQRAQMAERLGERHPEMVNAQTAIASTEQRIRTEVQKVVQAVRNEYQAAVTQEQTVSAALDEQKSEAMKLNEASIEYGALQRSAESNRGMFQGLLQRTLETDISSQLRTNNVRVVDQATTPRRPSSPRPLVNLVGGLIGGLVFAFGLTFLTESLDSRVKSPEEIKADLGIPFLGIVPIVSAAAPEGPLLSQEKVPHDFAEAIRGVRTNVLFSVVEDGCKSIVITSTGPREGKTVVAASLALAVAQAGQRVLLTDCDMRRPRIHELLDIPQEPGLSNVMVGEVRPDEAVRQMAAANIWALPAGKLPPNPAELLGSARFAQFLAELKQHFDWIILDSPPVLAVTDASVLAHQATGVLFVIGAEMTGRGAAKAALEQLDAVKARHFGAVLNKVDLRRNSYYYSHYYRREYESYYREPRS